MEIFKKVLDFFKGINKGKAIRIAVLSGLIIAIALTATLLLNRTSYSVLYTGLDMSDAGEILAILDELNIPAKAQGEDTILVDSSQVASVRMQIASQGYPKNQFNYDIFNNSSALGSTDLDRQINLQFQMEVNLSESIKRMVKIKDALVILNMQESDTYVWSTDSKPASASVVIELEQGQRLNNDEVRAITMLVSKSVSGLLEENVSIVDTQMVLYSIDDEDYIRNVGTQLEVQNEVRRQYQEQILKLLDPVFGAGNVKAEVNVILNFDKTLTEKVEYASPTDNSEGIQRSYQNLCEIVRNADESGGVVGVDSNSANANQYSNDIEIDENAEYQKITEQANMEINQTKTSIENAQGTVEEVSVAIVLNSTNNVTDFTDSVQELIAKTIGTDEENITVMMMPFAQSQSLDIESAFANRTQVLTATQSAVTTRMLIIIGACFIGLILLIAIIRALREPSYEDYEEYEEYVQPVGKQENSKDGVGQTVDITADEEIVSQVPDLKFATGNPSLNQLGKYINSDPESVAMLLKKWLYDD